MYGFIGPNGAGKTTTMRILATLLNPTWGEATVCGYSIYNNAKEIRRLMGYMPDFFGVYDDMKVIEYLEFFAAAYRIKGPERRKKCDQVLDLVDLGYKRDALVTSLSRGMTQRLGLARVLLHDPQVLLLDEPASGLDPRARIEMRDAAQGAAQHGQDDPGLQPHPARAGRHLQQDRHHRARQTALRRRRAVGHPPGAARTPSTSSRSPTTSTRRPREQLEGHVDVLSVDDEGGQGCLRVTLADGVTDGSFLADLLMEKGLRLKMFKEEEINLENVFMEITKGITN